MGTREWEIPIRELIDDKNYEGKRFNRADSDEHDVIYARLQRAQHALAICERLEAILERLEDVPGPVTSAFPPGVFDDNAASSEPNVKEVIAYIMEHRCGVGEAIDALRGQR